MNALPGQAVFVVTPTMRTLIEDAIEALLLVLDELDGDADRESCADAEPYLGWTIEGPRAGGTTDDREEEHDGREPVDEF